MGKSSFLLWRELSCHSNNLGGNNKGGNGEEGAPELLNLYQEKCEISSEREGERDLSSAGVFPRWPQQLVMGQAETQGQELHAGFPYMWQGPKHWAISCYFFQAISRQLDLKWNNLDTNWHHMGCWCLMQQVSCYATHQLLRPQFLLKSPLSFRFSLFTWHSMWQNILMLKLVKSLVFKLWAKISKSGHTIQSTWTCRKIHFDEGVTNV